jgi:endonuclease G
MNRLKLLFVFVVLLSLSCNKQLATAVPETEPALRVTLDATTAITENFETGSKTAYAVGDVTVTTGSWHLDDALLGTSASDAKNGTQSVRIRNIGSLSMNFNVTGASTVTVKHAVFGADGSSTWELLQSTNGGSSYSQVGSIITSSSTSLATASFTVNAGGTVRFKILKLSGGTNRINIDDVTINPASGGGGGGGTDNDHLLLGNPSNAAAVIDSVNNYLMVKTYYDISYSRDRGTPNWVSWHLYSGDLGSQARLDNFRADSSLPAGWYQVQGTSYSGSGFDRGHNCPSGDRTLNASANSATFLMDNMVPQAPVNNQQTWANMENYIRTQITAGNEAYIIMGSYGKGGTGSSGFATTINSGHVTVPANIWKVVVLIPNGNGDLSRITGTTRVISVIVPNNNTVSSDWKTYRTSVNAIQAATGYNLLSSLPAAVQQTLESKVDNQ